MTTQTAPGSAGSSSSGAGAGAAGGSASTLLGSDGAGAGGAGTPAAGAAGGAPAAGAAAGAAGAAGAAPDAAALAAKALVDSAKATADAAAAAAAGDFKFPEGFTPDKETVGQFKEWVKAHGVKGEAAQALVDLQVKSAQKQQEQFAADRKQQAADWEKELRADPNFGGEKFDQNLQLARAGRNAFASPQLKAFFAEHPIGNHPELLKMFAKVGAAIAEDKLVGANAEGGKTPSQNKSAFHQSMYPNSYEKMNGRR